MMEPWEPRRLIVEADGRRFESPTRFQDGVDLDESNWFEIDETGEKIGDRISFADMNAIAKLSDAGRNWLTRRFAGL